MKNSIKHCVLVALLFSMQACALLQFEDKSTDGYISKRAEQRWQALIDADFERAYQYEAPGYREAKSFDYFKNQFGGWVQWLSADTLKVERKSEAVATVRIRVIQDVFAINGQDLKGIASYHDEKWLNVDGEWWHYTK